MLRFHFINGVIALVILTLWTGLYMTLYALPQVRMEQIIQAGNSLQPVETPWLTVVVKN